MRALGQVWPPVSVTTGVIDADGYDSAGFNANGLDRLGASQDGHFDADGYDVWGIDRQGFDKTGRYAAGDFE